MQRLLELVAEGGVYSYADLAQGLGVSEGLVGQMIGDLARMGYLQPVFDGCGARCAGCPLAATCAIGGPRRVWALTEKGQLSRRS